MKPFDESLLTAYLDDELRIDERQLVEEHLAKDASLRALLEELSSVRQLVQGLSQIAPSLDMTPKILTNQRAVPASTPLQVSPIPNAQDSKSNLWWTMMAVLAASVIALLFSPWWLTDRIISSRPTIDSLPPNSPPSPMSRANPDQEQVFRGANSKELSADPGRSEASFGEAALALDAKQTAEDSTFNFESDSAANAEYSLSMKASGGSGMGSGGGMGGSGLGGSGGMPGARGMGGGMPGGGMGGMQDMAPASSRFSDPEVAEQGVQELDAQATDAFPRELNRSFGGKLSKDKNSSANTEEKLEQVEDRSSRYRSVQQPAMKANDEAAVDQPSAMPEAIEVFSDPSGIPATAMAKDFRGVGEVSSESLAFNQPTQPAAENNGSSSSTSDHRVRKKSALSEAGGEADRQNSHYFLDDSIAPDRLRTLLESESDVAWSMQADPYAPQELQSESFYSEQPMDPQTLREFGFRPLPSAMLLGIEALARSSADATSAALNAQENRNEPADDLLDAKASDQAALKTEEFSKASAEPSVSEPGVFFLGIPKDRMAEVVDRFRLSPVRPPVFDFEKKTEELGLLSSKQNAPFGESDSFGDRPPMLESPSQWTEGSEIIWLKVLSSPTSTSPQRQP